MAPEPKIDGLEAWDVEVKEVSNCVYVVRAVRETGNVFEKSVVIEGKLEGIFDELRAFESTIQQRKLEARS